MLPAITLKKEVINMRKQRIHLFNFRELKEKKTIINF